MMLSYAWLDDDDGDGADATPFDLIVLNCEHNTRLPLPDADCAAGASDVGTLRISDAGSMRAAPALPLSPSVSSPPPTLFWRLWRRARLRVCADGGANRLFDATLRSHGAASSTSSASPTGEQFLPTLVCGDLDSIRTDVAIHYANEHVPIVRSVCQDTTDLEKCLVALRIAHRHCSDSHGDGVSREQCVRHAFGTVWHASLEEAVVASASETAATTPPAPVRTVCVFGAFGGRFDQQMAAIHAALAFRGITVIAVRPSRTL